MPRPFHSLTFFPSGKLSETQKGSFTKCFGTVKQNRFTENRDTPPLFMHENFRSWIFSQTKRCSPTKCFSTVRQKKDGESRDAHPVSYSEHFSISKSFWSTIAFLYEMFRYCETSTERKKFSGGSWYTSPSYARKNSILKIFWKTGVPLRNASVLWAKKTDEDPDAHPLSLS